MGLPDKQRRQFDEDGFLVIPAVFSKREITQMAAEADRLAQWQVNISLALGHPTPRLDVHRRDGRVVLRKMQPVNDVSPVFTMFSRDERVVGPLRDLFGCEPMLMEEQLNYKQVLPGDPDVEVDPAGGDESYPFHYDAAFFRLDGYPGETLTAAITIDETTPENGPLRVIPGSHRRQWPLQGEWPPFVDADAVVEDDAVPVLAPPGSVLLIHSALVHASSANRTDRPRRIMVFSHYPEWHEVEYDRRCRPQRLAGQAAEDRYEELVYSGVPLPEYRLR